MNGSLKSDEQLFTMFCAFLAHDHRGKWYTIDVASLLQGFSKQETNNLLQSPATRGRELKRQERVSWKCLICRPPRAGVN